MIIVYIILGLLVAVLVTIDQLDFLKSYLDSFEDYISGIITEILGIIITLIFVEKVFSNQKRKDEKKEEIKKLKRLEKVLEKDISKSLRYAFLMTHKPDNTWLLKKMQRNFEFNGLQFFDCHSLLIDDMPQKAYKLFSKHLKNIEISIKEALVNLDFKYFPEIEKIFLSYSDRRMDSDSILACLEFYDLPQGETFKSGMKKGLQDIPAGEIPKEENYPSNAMLSFINLYHTINSHIKFSERYFKEMSKIHEESKKFQ